MIDLAEVRRLEFQVRQQQDVVEDLDERSAEASKRLDELRVKLAMAKKESK